MKNRLGWGVAFACALTSGQALAEPYEFVAHYDVQKDGQPPQSQAIVITKGMILADHAPAVGAEPARKLERISVRLKSDSISRSALATMRNISFQLRDVTLPCAPGAPGTLGACTAPLVNIQRRGATAEATLIDGNAITSAKPVVAFKVDARLHYDPDFLCNVELDLRASKGQAVGKLEQVLPFVNHLNGPAAQNAVTAKGADPPPAGLYALSMLANHGLRASDGAPLAYSFCKDIVDHVNFSKVPRPPGKNDKAVRDGHQLELSNLIIAELRSQSNITAHVVPDGNDANIVVEDKFSFSVARSVDTLFSFQERSRNTAIQPDPDNALPHIVDQDSTIELAARGPGCITPGADCDTVVQKHLSAQIEGQDKAGNAFKKEVELVSQGGARWTLKASLRDFYGQTVTFVLVYKLDGQRFRLLENTVDVENLGFVTSFPLVSEVVSLASKAASNEVNPRDTEWQSSIPLSWAFNLKKKDGRSLAVTLPWMMSFNSRAIDPRFSDKVKFFPHVSAVLPVSSSNNDDDKAKPELVFGAGLAFVNTFTLSWGISTRAAENYALIGISLPDLVRALKLPPSALLAGGSPSLTTGRATVGACCRGARETNMAEMIAMPQAPYAGPPAGFIFCRLLASNARESSVRWSITGCALGVLGASALALGAIYGEAELWKKCNLVLSAGGGLLLVLMRYALARADAASLASSGATEALIPRAEDPADAERRDALAWERGLAVRAAWVRSRVEAGQLLAAGISPRREGTARPQAGGGLSVADKPGAQKTLYSGDLRDMLACARSPYAAPYQRDTHALAKASVTAGSESWRTITPIASTAQADRSLSICGHHARGTMPTTSNSSLPITTYSSSKLPVAIATFAHHPSRDNDEEVRTNKATGQRNDQFLPSKQLPVQSRWRPPKAGRHLGHHLRTLGAERCVA